MAARSTIYTHILKWAQFLLDTTDKLVEQTQAQLGQHKKMFIKDFLY